MLIMGIIIGLTGRIGAGKSIVSGWLRQKGFAYYRLSDIVREEAGKKGIPIVRQVLQDIGDDLRKKNGDGILAERILEKISGDKVVIDSIRNPGEVEVLKRNPEFKLVAVDADPKIRFERVKERSRESDPENWEAFEIIDARDSGENEEKHGQQVNACIELADVKLENNFSSLEEFQKEIENKLSPLLSR